MCLEYVYYLHLEHSHASWRAVCYFLFRLRKEKVQKSPMCAVARLWRRLRRPSLVVAAHLEQGPPRAAGGPGLYVVGKGTCF